ncbi:MAG: polysaccharide export protein [Alkalinema sp. RL_2_19]|nr:polysaccharide export protein [Alkalinema sp. RL_2_19]
MRIFPPALRRLNLTIALCIGCMSFGQRGAIAQTKLPPQTPPAMLPQLQPVASNPLAPTSDAILLPSTRIPINQRARRIVDPVSYYIGPGDEIKISVVGYPEYSSDHSVLSDGTIALPLIGEVMAADRTPAQLKAQLTTLLNELLVNPAVTVTVSSQRPVTVNIGGSVQRPGPVQLRNLRPTGDINQSTTIAGVVSLQRPTVTAALLEAGGVTREADLSRVQLRRYSPDQTLPPVSINLWDAINADRPARDLTLQDGDTLYVPKREDNTTIDAQLLAKSSLAPRTVRVKVVGEVVRPGEVAVPPDGTLSSAIAIAGGPTDKARMKEVTFIRRLASGRFRSKSWI